jgi:hypothetical protein
MEENVQKVARSCLPRCQCTSQVAEIPETKIDIDGSPNRSPRGLGSPKLTDAIDLALYLVPENSTVSLEWPQSAVQLYGAKAHAST